MKKDTSFLQIKFLQRLIDPARILSKAAAVAVFSIIFSLTGCSSGSQLAAPENKLEISSPVAESALEEKSGFFYPTSTYNSRLLADPKNKNANEYYAFHVANYALNGSNEATLNLDTANAEKQLKVSFLFKKKEVQKLDGLVGEYNGSADSANITEVKIYSPNGFVYLKETDKLRVKILSVDKDIVTGEIEAEDGESKIKGKFAAKLLVAGKDGSSGNSNK